MTAASRRRSVHAPLTQATLLAEKHGLKVCIIDPNLEKRWIPNYGVWLEEWEALDKDLQVPVTLTPTTVLPRFCMDRAEGGAAAEACDIAPHFFAPV